MVMIYLDSSAVIYATESDEALGNDIRQRMANMPEAEFAISPLVVMECLVKPLRDDNFVLKSYYEEVLGRLHLLDFGLPQFISAAEIRARTNVATPDSIHVATALSHGCSQFWTGDDRLARTFPDFAVNVLAA